MRKVFYRFLIFILAAMVLTGCATRKEIVQFKDDTYHLKEQVRMLRAENEELKKLLKELNTQIASLQDETRRNKADILAEVNALKDQSQFLDNKLEDNISQISRILQKVERPSPMMEADTTGDTTAVNLYENMPVDAAALYNNAYRDMSKGHYDLALQGFQEYLKTFPDGELAENAQYWIGECYYAQKEYQKAQEEFTRVITGYPQGRKVPAALLKIGYSLANAGDFTSARKYLDLVIERYPRSEEAKLARARLSSF